MVIQDEYLRYPVIEILKLTSAQTVIPVLDKWLVGLCCLMTPGLSKDIRCHV